LADGGDRVLVAAITPGVGIVVLIVLWFLDRI